MRRPILLGAILAAATTLPAAALAAGTPPTVVTGAASSITDTTAVTAGQVNPNGLSTTYAFQYGRTINYGAETTPAPVGSDNTNHNVTQSFSKLTPGTTYHYRVIAFSSAGTSAGSDVSFTTTGTAPPAVARLATVSTKPATKAGPHIAQLNGTIRTRDVSAKYYFEYGPTPFYGSQTPTGTAGQSSRTQKLAWPLSGLEASQTYHFRVVAQMPDGRIVLGHDRTFVTQVAHRYRPRQLTIGGSLRRARPKDTIVVSGRLLLAPQVSADLGCNGPVDVQIKQGNNVVALKTVDVAANCSYNVRLRIARRRLGSRRPLHATARFEGNDVTGPASTRVLSLGRR